MENASNKYWNQVLEICDILWIDDQDDFVDPALEQECWPLISYFVDKKSPRYWAQEDPEEAWKHNPPKGTLTQGALELMDALILPKFKKKACELELPTATWEDQVLPLWIQSRGEGSCERVTGGRVDKSGVERP